MMKTILAFVFLGGAAVAFGAWRHYKAGSYEWELLNRVPTSRIEDAKKYRVFAGEFEVSPAVVDLGDTTYKIEEAWVEHRTEPERASTLSTVQRVYPEMVLLVRITAVARNPQLAQSAVRIKKEKGREVYGNGYRDVLLSEVGANEPTSFILRCDTREREVVVALKKKAPNQTSEPTRPSRRGSP
jgi:hypothetical protein